MKIIIRPLLITLFLIVSVTMGFAQTQKGRLVLGGSFDAHFTTPIKLEPDYKESNFYINPNVGYLITNNLELGVNSSFSRGGYVNLDSDAYGTGQLSTIGVYGIKYFSNTYIKPFVGLDIKLGISSYESSYGYGSTTENKTKEADLMFGVAYFFNEYVCMKSYLNMGISNIAYNGQYQRYPELELGVKIGFATYF